MSEILINRAAYLHNLEQICKKVGSKDKVFVILKDNAYGHGAHLIAALASEFGIETAVVRTQDEASQISSFFRQIIILSHIPNSKESDDFIYAINSLDALNIVKPGIYVHLAIDTMMHRHGLNSSEFRQAFEIAKKRDIHICGAYTHFRSSDEISGEFYTQKENFKAAKAQINELRAEFGIQDFVFHSCNSAAIERTSEFADECVRVGIAQFGYAQFDESLKLRKVLSLWADKISSRTIKKGQSVGYGGIFTASEDMRVATYDLGYGDGLLRYGGYGDLRLANGARILGKMSMDSFSCIDGEDRICVFDDANIWADFFGTINYDILVKLSPNIKRSVV